MISKIPGFEKYLVTEDGRVFNAATKKPLRTFVTQRGYERVGLYVPEIGKQRRHFVHVLVAAAFLGPKPEGFTVNHKDENKLNNRANNLEYLSPADNVRYSIGRFSKEDLEVIRYLIKRGVSDPKIASCFEVCAGTIQCIREGRTWT